MFACWAGCCTTVATLVAGLPGLSWPATITSLAGRALLSRLRLIAFARHAGFERACARYCRRGLPARIEKRILACD